MHITLIDNSNTNRPVVHLIAQEAVCDSRGILIRQPVKIDHLRDIREGTYSSTNEVRHAVRGGFDVQVSHDWSMSVRDYD